MKSTRRGLSKGTLELAQFCRSKHPRLVGMLTLYCANRDLDLGSSSDVGADATVYGSEHGMARKAEEGVMGKRSILIAALVVAIVVPVEAGA